MVIYSYICGNGDILISQSSDNPNRAYCKCLYANTPRDCDFWCWVDEYLPCPCGNGPCNLHSATVNSEAMKYKTAPLQHRDLLEKLFEGLSATEDFAWSSVDYPWDGEAIPSYNAPINPVREPTPGSTSRSRTGEDQLRHFNHWNQRSWSNL
ncbi:hypothetical protein GIB67_027428 [Kingdonia uniflora]|uniref:Uncharacterized protein n=1 Tax=Kingdonia uniflora TaxID=39325 RepID=A0A7J7MFB1_9MAGN|nr:hypothetical protein GIB67_027428 [Kingdonia uniflora]